MTDRELAILRCGLFNFSREPAVPGGAGWCGVLLHEQDVGPETPRRPRDGAGLVQLPPELAQQVPGVQEPGLLHRRRELCRYVRPWLTRNIYRLCYAPACISYSVAKGNLPLGSLSQGTTSHSSQSSSTRGTKRRAEAEPSTSKVSW